jgi:HlyD family secretion protein
VIDKSVSLGQVIASATNVVGGGTTLVTIADLSHVLDSALVNESDIGRVRVGQDVAVTVAAYPNQTFHGIVTRISPEAIIQQSVTMFPVLIALDNAQRRLLPGMNSDATINVTRITDALTGPNDAIASPQEARQLAFVLGAKESGADSSRRSGRGRGRGSRGAFSASVKPKGDTATAAARRAVVFVKDSATKQFAMRPIMISDGNYDVTRVVTGLRPGESVALLSDVRVAAARDSSLQRVQGRSGISGMMGGGPRGGGGAGRGAGGR